MRCSMTCETKRLFFGVELEAPWPQDLPKEKRVIQEKERHLTLLFLGMQNLDQLLSEMENIPKPSFQIGPVGLFDECLFFTRCVAWHVLWLTHQGINEYQKELSAWLEEKDFVKHETRPFKPHVTLARFPFDKKAWHKSFKPTFVKCTALHLYESLGHSTYQSAWHTSFIDPFSEIEHTADMAFIIRGTSLQELYIHAQMALSFHFRELTPFCSFDAAPTSLDEIITLLNHVIAKADMEIGSPLKAVSFHGSVETVPPHILQWEMIVDV